MAVRDRGFALVLVLVATGMVFTLAMHGAVLMRTSIIETRVLHERAQAEMGAYSAATLVVSGLFLPNVDAAGEVLPPGSDSAAGGLDGDDDEQPDDQDPELPEMIRELLRQSGALDELEEQAEKTKEESRQQGASITDGSGMTGRTGGRRPIRTLEVVGLPIAPVPVAFEDRTYLVTLKDAAGQLNINKAEEDQLERFLLAHGVEAPRNEAIAQQLLDWRDTDDFERERGAEADAYERRGIGCRNDNLSALEELLYLPDMTMELYERIRPDLSIGGDGLVHVGSASREVLMSVPGASDEFVRGILQLRREAPITEEVLDRIIPIGAAELKEAIRAAPSNIVRIEVAVDGSSNARYEGLAIIGDAGIDSLGLRPR